jgi:hypothetical protein
MATKKTSKKRANGNGKGRSTPYRTAQGGKTGYGKGGGFAGVPMYRCPRGHVVPEDPCPDHNLPTELY